MFTVLPFARSSINPLNKMSRTETSPTHSVTFHHTMVIRLKFCYKFRPPGPNYKIHSHLSQRHPCNNSALVSIDFDFCQSRRPVNSFTHTFFIQIFPISNRDFLTRIFHQKCFDCTTKFLKQSFWKKYSPLFSRRIKFLNQGFL